MAREAVAFAERKPQMREIPGAAGYLVTDDGRVFTTVYRKTRWNLAATAPPREKAKSLNQNGYYEVCLVVDGLPKRDAIHRLVARTFLGPRPFPKAEVRHLNGIRTDCRVDNLAWGTSAQNTDDMRRHGTFRFGEESPNAKLSRANVALIRAAHAAGVDSGFLAQRFSVSSGAIFSVFAGKHWKAVNPDANGLPELMADYARYPKRNSGTKNRAAKLTDDLVREIRRRHAAGASMCGLGRAFGVHIGTIRPIVLRHTWRHVLE